MSGLENPSDAQSKYLGPDPCYATQKLAIGFLQVLSPIRGNLKLKLHKIDGKGRDA